MFECIRYGIWISTFLDLVKYSITNNYDCILHTYIILYEYKKTS